jgi:alpha-tubulin suppressor-like RCC1 family protein
MGLGIHNDPKSYPQPQIVPGLHADAIAAGGIWFCSHSGGQVSCWGRNNDEQTGVSCLPPTGPNGFCSDEVDAPALIPSFGGVTSFALGGVVSCAFTPGTATGVSCWGSNGAGQLAHSPGANGDHVNDDDAYGNNVPQDIGVPGIKQFAMGLNHVCALLSSGTVACWGMNGSGELANGLWNGNSSTPTVIKDLTNVDNIGSGADTVCAVSGGKVKCWGANSAGQAGHVPTNDQQCSNGPCVVTPTEIAGLSSVREIASGPDNYKQMCAVKTDGTVWCWGVDSALIGHDGASDPTCENDQARCTFVPAKVEGLSEIDHVQIGITSACAQKHDGTIWCWGDNQYGQLGPNGTVGTSSFTPLQITGL